MTPWTILTPLAALGNSLMYAFVYRTYLHPVYPQWFDIVPRGAASFAITVLGTLLPLFLRSRRLSAASALATLVYVLYFVPTMWQFHYGLHMDDGTALALQATLGGCMAVLFLASRESLVMTIRVPRMPADMLLVATAAMLLVIAWSYRSTMSFVGFDEVYELRFASLDAGASAWVGYLVMWCTYCLVPYCIARGLHARQALPIALGLAGSLIIYMATGAKSSVLTPLILAGLYVVMRSRRHFTGKTLMAVIGGSAALLWLAPAGPLFEWARSVFFMRTMGSSGWTTSIYYEYFSRHGYTYYSHIGAIDAITGDYARYRPYSLGQTIGLEVSGNDWTNFNSGFWGSDGLAALGMPGLAVVTLFVAVYFVLINLVSRDVDRRFAALWSCGFGMALLNLPFGTSMLSGGGVLMLLLFLVVKMPPRHASAGRPGPAAILPPPCASST